MTPQLDSDGRLRHLLTHTAGFVTDDPWGDRVLGMTPAEALERAQAHDRDRYVEQALNPRERYIVAERKLKDEGRTLESLGEELGLSKERVRQLEAAAFAKIAVPEMLKAKYDPALATGCVASAGTLGSLIPPSILMIVWGGVLTTSILSFFFRLAACS